MINLLKILKPKICSVSLLLFLMFFGVEVLAQTDTIIPIKKDPEELLAKTKVRVFTGEGFNFFEDRFEGHFAGIDFGFNALIKEDYTGFEPRFMKNDIKYSNALHLNFFQKSFGLQRNRNNLGLVTGVGVLMQEYRLNDSITIKENINGIVAPVEVSISDKQKSKLYNFSLIVPLLAEVQIPINNYRNRLYFSGGMYVGCRIGSFTKVKYKTDYRQKLKTTDDFSMNNFKYGIMARTGYRWINFYMMYELTPLFKNGEGPVLTPLTFGFTIIRF